VTDVLKGVRVVELSTVITARAERALPAPTLAEHTDAVLAELGYDASEIVALRAAKVI